MGSREGSILLPMGDRPAAMITTSCMTFSRIMLADPQVAKLSTFVIYIAATSKMPIAELMTEPLRLSFSECSCDRVPDYRCCPSRMAAQSAS